MWVSLAELMEMQILLVRVPWPGRRDQSASQVPFAPVVPPVADQAVPQQFVRLVAAEVASRAVRALAVRDLSPLF